MEQGVAARALAQTRRLVVKVGSALVVEEGAPRAEFLADIAADLSALRARGVESVVVTSGAIALGRARLGLVAPLRLEEKQAASAAGQLRLAEAWQKAFDAHGVAVAQVLITLDDTENRKRYLNARATFETLLALGAAPLVNENDTIATSEIRYGDNDRLAAHAAQLAGADLLVILSDVDGLYTSDPRSDPSATHICEVARITAEMTAAAGGPNRAAGVGSGGMASKIAAARIATDNGVATIIASGRTRRPLQAIADGARATLFQTATDPRAARRRWIGGRLKIEGALVIDDGAAAAIRSGASLLPAGVKAVEGEFARGAAVELRLADGRAQGVGLASFSAEESRRIAGLRSADIAAALGYECRPAMVERDNLALSRED
jgi:glutamate 5-kinase